MTHSGISQLAGVAGGTIYAFALFECSYSR